MFVLNVDLWSSDGSREVNLVRHSAANTPTSATGPSIMFADAPSNPPAYSNILPGQSSTAFKFEAGHGRPSYTQSYHAYAGQPPASQYPQHSPPPQDPYPGAQSSYQSVSNGSPPYPPQNGYAAAQPMYIAASGPPHSGPPGPPGNDYANPSQALNFRGGAQWLQGDPQRPQVQPTGMFTRNLIGSLSASASRLTDPNERIGIWFVLQDLSVRTEGSFRFVPPMPPLLK
jgi:hypothetical protein